jgi:hypothetical protein
MSEDATDFFVDIATDALDTTTSSQAPDGRLRNALDVLSHDFAMALRTAFAETFTTFATSRHLRSELNMAPITVKY